MATLPEDPVTGVEGGLQLEYFQYGQGGKQKQNLPVTTPCVQRTDANNGRFVGGYECEFVNPPPDYLQTECSVCLLVLRSPHITSCCGHNFCKECIERLRTGGKACPLCNEARFNLTFNRAHDVSLKQIEVYCTLRRIGCGWQGKLEMLEQHLNADSGTVLRPAIEGCAYVEIPCSQSARGCGKFIQRRLITQHQFEECLLRLFTCKYCHKFTSTYHEVATTHWPVCKFYPVHCPNKCTQNPIQRQNLKKHLSTKCPLQVVECEFKFAGCKMKVSLSDMAKHVAESVSEHLSLVARQNQQLMSKLEEKERNQKKLEEKMQQLATERDEILAESCRRAIQEKYEQIQSLTYGHELGMLEMKQRIEGIEEKLVKSEAEFQRRLSPLRNKASAASVKTLKERVEKLKGNSLSETERENLVTKEQLEACIGTLQEKLALTTETITKLTHHLQIAPVQIVMPEFQEHKRDNLTWTSDGFYTHPRGYKLCLLVYANGVQDAKGTHVSVCLYLMRGEYDHLLSWPFQADVNIKLLNQRGTKHHLDFYASFIGASAERVISGERASKGWGWIKLVHHSDLELNPLTNCQYLKNNCLQFQVII